MRTLLADIRYGVRLLLKDRSFAAAALLTLAVCIGANAAIFSVVRSVILSPLPVPASERLLLLFNAYPKAGVPMASTGVPDYYDRLRETTAFTEQALYRRQGYTLAGEGAADRLNAVRATPSFFRITGVQPVHGRIFRDDEGEEGQERKALISNAMWQERFGADPKIVGRMLRLSGLPHEVVGVMPAGFRFLWNDIDLWVPAAFTAEEKSDDSRHSNNWTMIAQLKPEATLPLAQEQLHALNARNDERFPQFRQILKDAGFTTTAVKLQDQVVGEVRPILYLLWGGVLFVLLIGCVNIANLVIVRSHARSRELATRHAMGAGLGRLSRQLFTESVMLAGLGGLLGIAVGWWALAGITALAGDQLPRGHEVRLDVVSAAAIFGLSLVVGVLIGLVPVIRLRRTNLNTTLREEGRSGTSGRGASLVRRGLATAQVAIACVLLIGAGLLLASFRAVLKLDTGFDPSHVVAAAVSLPRAVYADDAAIRTFTDRMLASIRGIPGVDAAGVTTQLPFSGDSSDSVILAEGYTMAPGESLISPRQTWASDGYFEAMKIPLVRGRYFDRRDTAESTPVIIVDERLAQKFWPGTDPLNRRMYNPTSPKDVLAITPETRFMTVVGVVKNVQMSDPSPSNVPVGAYYMPTAQDPTGAMMLVARTSLDRDSFVAQARRQIAQLDPELPLYSAETMEDMMDEGFVGRRVPMLIAGAFGLVALLLAALGIYGVLAYGVAERRREIGIRMALGSSKGQVFGLVLGDGAKITVAGLVLGLAGGLALSSVMDRVLFGVTATDARVLGGVALVLALVALVATIVPARRAAKVNPINALQS
jgi:predicted permease